MRELIERIVKALVDKPEEISINEEVGESTTAMELKVAKKWLGKLRQRRS